MVKDIVIIKEDVCMKPYDERKFLYLQKDVARVGLGTGLLRKCN